jgi:hypothetical protein
VPLKIEDTVAQSLYSSSSSSSSSSQIFLFLNKRFLSFQFKQQRQRVRQRRRGEAVPTRCLFGCHVDAIILIGGACQYVAFHAFLHAGKNKRTSTGARSSAVAAESAARNQTPCSPRPFEAPSNFDASVSQR